MMSYVFLVGEVGKGMTGLALQSIGVRLHSEMRRYKRSQQKLGQLGNAGDGEGVHELEGRDGMKTDHSFGLGEESCSAGDAHQRVLEVYEWPLESEQLRKSDQSEQLRNVISERQW